MGRHPRAEAGSDVYHVMNRGAARHPVFFCDDDRIEFGRRLAAIHETFGVVTLAYCLMGNHFHLLLRAPPGRLSEAMQHLGSVYTRHTNSRLGRDGPLFRGRFHSIPVETDEYLLWVTRYIHLNALDVAGVERPEDYRWSSHRAYLGLRPEAGFLDTSLVLSLFDGSREAFAAFVDGGPAARPDLRSVVACAVAIDDLSHPSDDGPTEWLERTVMNLMFRGCREPRLLGELSAHLGERTAGAVRTATCRAEQRRRTDPRVDRVLRWVEATLAVTEGV